jgi:LCP family protein required for cell wall assembly
MGRRSVKKKKGKVKILSILLFFFIAAIGYSFYEYKAGFYNASTKIDGFSKDKDTENSDDFEGQKNDLGKVNILLLGVDSATTTKSLTDTIMIAQYDAKNGTAKIASIMRDTYVTIPDHSKNKINSALSFGGPELLRQTIKENFGIDVEYYALVNFDGFTEVVDTVAPDGVEIDVEKRMRYVDNAGGLNINFDPGLQKLNGEDLLKYARFRNDSESDFGRVRRQQQVIAAVKDEFVSVKGVVKLPRILGTIQPFIKTNMEASDMLAFSKDFLLNPIDEIETIRIPVDDSYRLTRSNHAGSVISFDKEANEKAVKDFFSTHLSDEQSKTANKENSNLANGQ